MCAVSFDGCGATWIAAYQKPPFIASSKLIRVAVAILA